MVNKSVERYLISFILKNELYFSGPELNDDLKKFIFKLSIDKKSCLFNIYDQIWFIKKFRNLLEYNVRISRKPILFFGVNSLGFSPDNSTGVDLINEQIFKLCFTVLDKSLNNIKVINKKISSFFVKSFSIGFLKESDFLQIFKLFEKDLLFLLDQKKIRLNGFFYNNWVGGHFSNFHFIKAHFNDFISNSLLKTGLLPFNKQILFFHNKFINLHSTYNIASKLSEGYGPGLVIFFSSFGYSSFIKEFYKLGTPIACIVDEDDSLDFIDYPLLGDSSNINVLLFYCHFIEECLKKEKQYEADN